MENTVLSGALLALAGVTAFNLVMLFAVVRRQKALESPATSGPSLPAIGWTVRSFDVADLDGERLTDRDVTAGPVVVGFVTSHCRPCGELANQLNSGEAPADADLALIVVGDPTRADVRELTESLRRAARVAVVSENAPILAAFQGVNAFPTLVRLVEGRIVAAGHTLAEVATVRVTPEPVAAVASGS